MAAALLPTPVLQFLDADGQPYAGGTLATYIPDTSTPKTTWVDHLQAAVSTNPIVLDSAGRCIVFGDGAYRCVLRDSVGNLIFDQYSDTLVSAAMAPVVSAPTLEDAREALGITDAIADEAADRAAAIDAEATARTAADTTLQANIDAEETARIAGDATLQSDIDALEATVAALTLTNAIGGQSATDGSGHVRVTFATPFATACDSFVCTVAGTGLVSDTLIASADATGADVWMTQAGSPIAKAGAFYWMALGH
jgi:hypothetical protein